jgi:hypothetical protein
LIAFVHRWFTVENLLQHPPEVIDAPVVGHGIMFAVVDEPAGIVAPDPKVGDTPIVGTAATELTPRLPISRDPNGMPVRAAPPGVVGDVDIGVDDEAMLLEPEPHMPDSPVVSGIPEVADIADDDDSPDMAVVPDVAAVAGVAAPAAIPPPS